jgi:hypothetical protein
MYGKAIIASENEAMMAFFSIKSFPLNHAQPGLGLGGT